MNFKQNLVPVAILIGFLLFIFGIDYIHTSGLFSGSTKAPANEAVIQKYAAEVMEVCGKDSYPPSCYDTEIPKLMDRGVSIEDSFKVTSVIQTKTNGYFFCHVLGHNLSAKETAKDPSKWTEVIGKCPTGMCSNGCLHGAAQERFRSEVLTPEQQKDTLPQLAKICQPGSGRSFTGLEQASCYHALGHLAMYITGADIKASTNICNVIAKVGQQDYTQTCYEGAYMQIFQPLEPEDFTLVKDIAPQSIEAAEKYCRTFTGEYNAACHRESWPLYRESLTTSKGLQYFCSLVPDKVSSQRCYNAMFYVLTAQLNFEIERITPLCEALPEKQKAQCFANAASRSVETDYRLSGRAVELCKVAENHGVGERCYNELLFYSSFNYHEGSPEFKAMCNALPEPWKTKCLNGEGKTAHPTQGSDSE